MIQQSLFAGVKRHAAGPAFKLRPYQQDALDAVRQQLAAGKRRLLVAMATGTGKTIEIAPTRLDTWLVRRIGEQVVVLGETKDLATANRAEILAIMRQQAESDICGDDIGASEVAMVCRLAGVNELHAGLGQDGWTVLASSPTLRRESTRPTLRQALACALLPHVGAQR